MKTATFKNFNDEYKQKALESATLAYESSYGKSTINKFLLQLEIEITNTYNDLQRGNEKLAVSCREHLCLFIQCLKRFSDF